MPAVFRLTDHIRRLFDSAKIFDLDIPFTVDELIDATKETVRINELKSCYIRPLVFLGDGEMGLNIVPCKVSVAIAVWPWGTYLGDEGIKHGVRCKISSWQRHDPNSMPPAAKGDRACTSTRRWPSWKRSRAGTTRRIMLNGQGFVSECTGENIFIVRNGTIITPPLYVGRARGHHAAHGEDDRRRPRVSTTASTTCSAATSTSPTRRSSPARRPRSSRSGRSTTARSASRARSPGRSRRSSTPRSRARSTSTRNGTSTSSD